MPTNRRVFRNEIKSRKRLLNEGSSGVYHVMSRTACNAFLFDPQAKEVFKSIMCKQARFAGIEILTFCIMDNHFHLLLRVPAPIKLSNDELLQRYQDYYGESKTPQSTYSLSELKTALIGGNAEAETAYATVSKRMANLPSFMRELKQRFTIWYNQTHQNKGTIWAARYKSLLVEDCPESLTKVAAYIDLNPVRAEIVDDPEDYRWCGYAESMAGIQLATQGIKGMFHSAKSNKEAIQSYRLILFGKGYHSKGNTTKDQGRISGKRLSQIAKHAGEVTLQEMLRVRVRYFTDGMAIGSQEFLENNFQQNRLLFGKNRNKGAHRIKGPQWEGLCVTRDLKKNVYS